MRVAKKLKEENEKIESNINSQYQNGYIEMKKEREKYLEEKINQEYKKLKTILFKSRPDYKAILFVSSLPGEGSTSVVTHLAKEFLTEQDRKIILIDANLRNPDLHNKLGINQANGLIDIIKDTTLSKAEKMLHNATSTDHSKTLRSSINDRSNISSSSKEVAEFIKKTEEEFENNITQYIKKTDYKNLMAITSGLASNNNTSFPENGNMSRLIKCLKKRFDHILLDGAPVNLYKDSLFIAPHVDGIILVVEADKTRREIISKVKGEFENINSKIIGVILNKKKYYIPERIYKLI